MKVKVYPTLLKAQQDLRPAYYRNGLVFSELVDQTTAMVKNVRGRIEAAEREEKIELLRTLHDALTQIFKKEQVTMAIKLYNCNKGYALEVNYVESTPESVVGYVKSVGRLVKVCRDEIKDAFPREIGIDVLPIMYTVEEPYRLSEEEIEKYKALVGYEKVDLRRQSEINTALRAYIEYGLGPEERQDFEQEYLKFLN